MNYLAVVVAAVVNFAIGALWYGPLFGKTWMSLMGFTKESMKSMKMTPTQAMTWGFIGTLVLSYVLAYFVGILGVADAAGALSFTFWVWLGFFATTLAGSVLWEGKPAKLYAFNLVYYFVALYATTLVLVLWK